MLYVICLFVWSLLLIDVLAIEMEIIF